MNNRVLAAFAFGSALLLAAYTFSDFGAPKPPMVDSTVDVVTAKAPPREYIPSTDSNEDGIPDWQDVLLNTTPLALEIGASTTYQEPTTLTDRFAITFFESYVRDKGYGDFAGGPDDIIAATNDSLVNQTRDKLYTNDDIVFAENNDVMSIKNYGNAMALIVLSGPEPKTTRNEVTILEDAVAQNNEAILKELDSIIIGYQYLHDGFKKTAVPVALAKEHLDLLNSVNAILNDIKAMQMAFSDPLFTLLRIKRYQDDTLGFYTAIVNLQNRVEQAGVTYQPNEPAAQGIIIKKP